jgi:hypothetical protein
MGGKGREGLASKDLASKGLASEGLASEGLASKGLASKGLERELVWMNQFGCAIGVLGLHCILSAGIIKRVIYHRAKFLTLILRFTCK